MNKWFLGVLLAIAFLAFGAAAPTFAAGTAVTPPPSFTGTYEGTVYGDYDSSAHLTLELTQNGRSITGTATIGAGLELNAGGFCGTAVLPPTTASADGSVSSRNPRRLSADIPVDVGGLEITALVSGDLSADGEELDIEVKVDTPFLCGRDPVITGTLVAISG